jgi:hypothetical protein
MFKKLVAIGAITFLTSCATILNENNRRVEVVSTPKASVVYEGNNYGASPATVHISGFKIYSGPKISVEKKGYRTQTKEVPTRFQGWTIVSFLLGILPGIVDVATGNALALDTNAMSFELEEEKSL